MVTIDDLRSGAVKRLKLSSFAKLADESPVTIGRKIKDGHIAAITDPASHRIFISAESALAYLDGVPYRHDFTNEAALKRMERARSAKQQEVS